MLRFVACAIYIASDTSDFRRFIASDMFRFLSSVADRSHHDLDLSLCDMSPAAPFGPNLRARRSPELAGPRILAAMAAADHLRALASFMAQVRLTPAFDEVAAAQHKHWADRLQGTLGLDVQDRKSALYAASSLVG